MDSLLWTQFHFLRPLWLLLLVPFSALALWLWRRNDPWQQWQGAFAPHLLPHMVIPGDQRRLFSPLWGLVALYPLVTLALAGPSWSRGESPFAEDSAALVIAIDLSASMAENDLQPSRLQRARDKALQLAQRRGDAYTALIAYAGTAHTVLPLSNDSTILLHYLDALEVGMLPRRGKAPENVIPLALELLEGDSSAETQGPGGTLLIIGDGANDSAAAAFERVADDPRVQLLVWGMGKTREAIAADQARGLSVSAQPLQEAQLRAIAAGAQGYYRALSTDDSDVADMLRRIDRHYLASEDSSRPWIDGGYYLLPIIALLFLLWFRSGWVLRW